MNKQIIVAQLNECYSAFIEYITGLTAEEYTIAIPGKWNAAQQLEHIILSVKPLVKVFGMERSAIQQTFGTTYRKSRSYDELLNDYLIKLHEGGKAPERFVPVTTPVATKATKCETLSAMITELSAEIGTFSEAELDTLLVPHPLLGNLTLREMLYNALYHVQRHQSQIAENLAKVIAG